MVLAGPMAYTWRLKRGMDEAAVVGGVALQNHILLTALFKQVLVIHHKRLQLSLPVFLLYIVC
jgi:hypothetical protein